MEKEIAMRGMIIFYINVGQLSPKMADKFIEKIKQDNAEVIGRIPPDWGVVYLPVRNEPTRVETTPPFDRE